MNIGQKLKSIIIVCFLLSHGVQAAEESAENTTVKKDDFFAIIDKQKVPIEEFQAAFRKGVREKFYHGKVSRQEIETFRKEVAEKLVDSVLLVQEAKRRKVKLSKAEESIINKKLDDVDSKNSKAEEWEDNKDKVLAIIKERLTGEALTQKLKENVKKIAAPSEKQLQKYYKDNPDKFTAPQQWGVSLIMLKVDPSSPSDAWAAATEEASSLVERIRAGANFKDLARIHSGDDSAENGGDMGYLHLGMLAKPAQQVLSLMEVNDISEPVMLLQGVAIFRLDGIKPARLNPFEKIKDRASKLWIRDQSEVVWTDLLKELKKKVEVKYGNTVFEQIEEKKS